MRLTSRLSVRRASTARYDEDFVEGAMKVQLFWRVLVSLVVG